MLVEENYVNRSEGYRTGESGLYEPFTEDLGALYRAYMRQFGRCIGRVYVDVSGKSKAVGWVFLKRQKYDDCHQTFLLETWVTIHERKPDVIVNHHYQDVTK